MKKLFIFFLLCIFFLDIVSKAESADYQCALGYASPSANMGILTLDDFYALSVTTSISNCSWSCGCDYDWRNMRAWPTDRLGFPQLQCSSSGPSSGSISGWVLGPGSYTISAAAEGGTSCGHEWGCNFSVSISVGSQCPNTVNCAKSNCAFCKLDYCAVHKRHITRFVSHNFNTLPGVAAAEHAHCSNSEQLLSEWQQNAAIRYCPTCNNPFCPLCPHVCGEFSCPLTPNCASVNCPVCNGFYCSVHAYHVCSNYHAASELVSSNLVSVQTSVSGQAIVNVDIAPAEINIDQQGVISAINTLQLSNSTAAAAINASIDGTNTRLDQLKSIADAISSKTETISANSDYLPVINQVLEGFQDPIFDLVTSSQGIEDGILVGIEGQGEIWAEVVDFKNMSELQLYDLNQNIQEHGAVLLDSKSLLESIDDSLKAGGDNAAVVSAINSFAVANNSNLQALSQTNTQIAESTASIDSKLDGIGSSVDALGDSLTPIDNSLGDISSHTEAIAESVQTLVDKQAEEDNLGFNPVSVGFGVPSDFVSPYDGVSADDPSITDLDFSAVKSKLFPPANMFSNLSGASVLSFDLPLIGEASIDLLSNSGPSHLIRLFSYAVCSLMYLFMFVSGVVRVFRQY